MRARTDDCPVDVWAGPGLPPISICNPFKTELGTCRSAANRWTHSVL
jgi:hypothetical protein